MINKEILSFLNILKENNNREWFNENKSEYFKAKSLFDNYISDFIQLLSSIDSRIVNLEAKDCVFRIYKDTRFSKDKTPYKTHFGAYISPGGRKSKYAGYYIHIEPGASFIGGGVYMPESDILKAIRTDIFDDPELFKSIINEPKFKNEYVMFSRDALKTAPKGFPKDWPDIELLRNKSYAFGKDLSDEDILDKDFTKNLLESFTILKTSNDWLNRIIDEL